MNQTVHTEVLPNGDRISIETTGHGWRRLDTIIRTSGAGRHRRVTVEYRHYGPFAKVRDAIFRLLAKNAD